MKKIKTILSVTVFSSIIFSIIGLQYKPYVLHDSLPPCCDNYQCNYQPCSSSSGVNHQAYQCEHISITCKECMDLWRQGLICYVTGNPYQYCMDGNYKYSSWCGYELPINIDIVGSHFAGSGVTSYFTTSASGGCPSHYPFHYQWRLYIFCDNDNLMDTKQDPVIDTYPCGSWINVGSDNPDYSFASDKNYKIKCTLYDNFSVNSPVTSGEWYVYIMDE